MTELPNGAPGLPGAPDRERLRILGGLAIMGAALWIDSLLPRAAADPFTTAFHFTAFLRLAPRAALVLLVMRLDGGLAMHGLGKERFLPSPADLAWSVVVAGALGLSALVLAFAAGSAGLSNPLLAAVPDGNRATPAYMAAITLSSLATGYAEESFFRVYAPSCLVRAGMGRIAAALACSVLFGAVHGAQGIAGMLTAGVLGAVLATFRLSGRSLHSIALGHAAYDFVMFLAL